MSSKYAFGVIIGIFLLLSFVSPHLSETTNLDVFVSDIKLVSIDKPRITLKKEPKSKRARKRSRPVSPAKKTPPKVVKAKVDLEKEAPPSNVVFKEDFSGYQVGHIMTKWGNNDVVVKQNKYRRKYITSQTLKRLHQVVIPINFSKQWSFTFSGNLSCTALKSIIFYDELGNGLNVQTGGCEFGALVVRLPSGASGKTGRKYDSFKGSLLQFEISYVRGLLKVFIDGNMIVSGVFQNRGPFAGIRLIWQDYPADWGDGVVPLPHDFYDFKVTKIKETEEG